MKIVIIGGGIAGFAAAIILRGNHQVIVKEKNTLNENAGLAFMLHQQSLDAISSLLKKDFRPNVSEIKNFVINSDDDSEKSKNLTGWYILKRVELLNALQSQLSTDEYDDQCEFLEFQYAGEKATAAIFKDGSFEKGDFFIGADGINSNVRNFICKAEFFPNEINEVVCLTKNDDTVSTGIFTKFHSSKKSISAGIIPITNEELIWIIQFSQKSYGSYFQRHTDIEKSIRTYLQPDLPRKIQELIDRSDLSKTYYWNNQELKLLPTYYKTNICLIGDAAHGSTSLTSSGVSSAISSANEISQALNGSKQIEAALMEYEINRKKEHLKVIEYSQMLKNQFFNPPDELGSYQVPLFE